MDSDRKTIDPMISGTYEDCTQTGCPEYQLGLSHLDLFFSSKFSLFDFFKLIAFIN